MKYKCKVPETKGAFDLAAAEELSLLSTGGSLGLLLPMATRTDGAGAKPGDVRGHLG